MPLANYDSIETQYKLSFDWHVDSRFPPFLATIFKYFKDGNFKRLTWIVGLFVIANIKVDKYAKLLLYVLWINIAYFIIEWNFRFSVKPRIDDIVNYSQLGFRKNDYVNSLKTYNYTINTIDILILFCCVKTII